MVQGDRRLRKTAVDAIEEAARRGAVIVPAIALWEVAMLLAKQRITLAGTIETWFEHALGFHGFSVAPITPAIAAESGALSGGLSGDPADRLIVATARVLSATLVTRDSRILAYAETGTLPIVVA